MSEELIAGLKNAMERGQSLEQAEQSFISAGYNPEEVRAAGDIISSSGGATRIVGWNENGGLNAKKHELPEMPKPMVRKPEAEGRREGGGHRGLLIIGLIIALLIFLGAIGYLVWVLMK